MSYVIAALMSISIMMTVSAFLISMRTTVIIDKAEEKKRWSILGGSITILILGLLIYAYALVSVFEISVERTIAGTVFLSGSAIVFVGAKIIYNLSKKIKQLKEETHIYLKCVEDINNNEIDSASSSMVKSKTGLYDNQHLFRKLDEEITRALRQKVPLYLVVFEIDQIDKEEEPDNILPIVGSVITNNIRGKIDAGFHIGDNEFAVTLPYTIRDQAITITKRILRELNSWGIQASMGLVSCTDTGAQTSTELIKIAAMAVGEAKAEGGNRIRLLENNAIDQSEPGRYKRGRIKHLKLLK